MEEIFISILNLIANEIPQLSLVDEDYGQLETSEDTYPVTFPCALIGNMEADWEEIGMGTQKGIVTLTTRLAIDCYEDTHIGSGTTEKVAERLRLANQLYTTLQCSRHSGDMGPMFRTKTRCYSLPGMIKVYEYVFQFELHDDSAAKD
nr:MAG TPA: hypothetical protein [Caudoviricetes sp.]